MVKRIAAALLLAASALSGCASTPQASPERDTQAKAFGTHPGYSTIYIYRPDPGETTLDADTVLYLDRRLIGSTLPQTYFRVDVQPGAHALRGGGIDQGAVALNTLSDELYFVELRVSSGVSHYRMVDAETGKRAIRQCCVLLESWAPGQRPLLR